MTLDQYQDQWSADADIDNAALDDAARNVPLLHAKWWKYFSAERLRFKMVEMQYKALYRQKWEWYLGKLDDAERLQLGWSPQNLKILSTNVSIYLDGDTHLQEAQKRKIILEETLKFIEDVIKQINNRNFIISSAINFLKFKHGLN